MAFTISDMHDLTKLLIEHPEWKAELRRIILTDELLALPELVRENSIAIKELQASVAELRTSVEELRTSVEELRASVAELYELQRRNEQQIAELVAAQKRTDKDIGTLKEDVKGLKQDVKGLKQDVKGLKQDVKVLKDDMSQVKGHMLEQKYIRGAPGYFGRWLRRIRILMDGQISPELEDQLEDNLTPEEVQEVLRLDTIIKGTLRNTEERTEIYLALEASSVIDRRGIERSQRRASLLRKAKLMALPVAAGHQITQGATALLVDLPTVILENGSSRGWDETLNSLSADETLS